MTSSFLWEWAKIGGICFDTVATRTGAEFLQNNGNGIINHSLSNKLNVYLPFFDILFFLCTYVIKITMVCFFSAVSPSID